MFATVLFPFWIANSSNSKSTNDNITSMDDTVKSPTEDAQVVPGGANSCRVIRGVTVIPINGIEIVCITLLAIWCVDDSPLSLST
jgi:hypothetical protein